ncbi:hypothetical protein FGO68_gene6508 [Halteria grandinella]|uniref:Uncharacterized protein n=1 Tax=Halteria grandinella TaxID=5974 RepID=A0A8J8T0V9_HALGN|nr:hypothetical protein FGO68_gene6508 [Halteria grandinella]
MNQLHNIDEEHWPGGGDSTEENTDSALKNHQSDQSLSHNYSSNQLILFKGDSSPKQGRLSAVKRTRDSDLLWQEVSTHTQSVDISEIKIAGSIQRSNEGPWVESDQFNSWIASMQTLLKNTIETYSKNGEFQSAVLSESHLFGLIEPHLDELEPYREELIESMSGNPPLDVDDTNVKFLYNLYQGSKVLDFGPHPLSVIGVNKYNNSAMPPFDSVSTVVVRTAECSGLFSLQSHQIQSIMDRRPYYDVDLEEIQQSLGRINQLLATTKGKQIKEDMRLVKVLSFSSISLFLLALLLGLLIHFILAIVFATLLIALILYFLLRKSGLSIHSKNEPTAHILVSLACRAENQGRYLRRHMRMRPGGFNARWLQIQFL